MEAFKVIKLTQGREALVDAEDFDRLNQHKWCLNNKGYAVRNIPVDRPGQKQTSRMMTRDILEDVPAGHDIDHIDGDRLNNRRSNLRVATRGENTRNQRKWKKVGTSRFKGVSYNRQAKSWRAEICCDYRKYYLGYFKDEVDAAKAYNDAARVHHGAFAKLNVLDEENADQVTRAA